MTESLIPPVARRAAERFVIHARGRNRNFMISWLRPPFCLRARKREREREGPPVRRCQTLARRGPLSYTRTWRTARWIPHAGWISKLYTYMYMYPNYTHIHAHARACMHAPIAANVYPVVGRLVECASKHEITLRFRNPVTTRVPLPPPPSPSRLPSRSVALALSRFYLADESGRRLAARWNTSTPITSPTRSSLSLSLSVCLSVCLSARRKLRSESFDR